MRRSDSLEVSGRLLDIPEKASISEIRKIFKELMFKWHPDTCKADKEVCAEKTHQIQDAYKTILAYCEQFPISFSREEMDKIRPQDDAIRFWYERFGDDPIWG